MKLAISALCGLAIAAACLPSMAHDHATGVVKERMDMMEAMAKRLKSIRERIGGKRDLAAIKADAEAIASHAPHLVHLFPPGSTQKPTDARATILGWSFAPSVSSSSSFAQTFSALSSALL